MTIELGQEIFCEESSVEQGDQFKSGNGDLKSTNPEQIKRILIYRCGTIGDTIVAVPAVNLLRRHFNKALFLLMTANSGEGKVWADDVLKEFDWFEEFITYSSSDLRRPRNIFTLIKKVRASNPDIVVYMASDKNSALKIWRDSLFFRLAGVKTFIPYYSTKITFWGLQKRADKVYPKEVVRLVQGLERLGINNREISFNLPIKQGHVQRVSELIAEAGLDSQRPLIGMCPWSKQGAKRWPIERYADLGEQLIRELNVNIAIVGGQEEAVVGKDISRIWPEGRWATFAGELGILETAELLRRCHFYVGNDTGSMHLAAAVDTPCVAIFSAREPVGSWYPYGDQHIVLRKKVPCRNCYLTECRKYNLRCLNEITLDEVWINCLKMAGNQRNKLGA